MIKLIRRTRYGYLLAVGGVAAALYLNSLWGEFVFDDHEAIENNPDVRSNTPLSEVFQNDFWGQRLSDPESHKSFRPLTTLSFRVNHLLHGLWPPGFHLINLLSHSLVSSLLCLLCLRLKLSVPASLACSLLFASHPIHTEAVANIVGRTELLSGIFFLLSLLSYQCCLSLYHKPNSKKETNKHSRQEPLINSEQLQHIAPTHFSWLWLMCSILLAAISMLCKEQGITVLGVCVAYDLFVACGKDLWEFFVILKQAVEAVMDMGWSREDVSKKRLSLWQKSFLVRFVIVIFSSVSLLFLRLRLNGGDPPLFVESDNPASFSPHLSTRFFTYVHLVVLNLWLLLCPSRLCFDWSMGSIPLIQSISDTRNLWSVLVAILLILFVFILGCSSFLSFIKANNKSAAESNGSSEELVPKDRAKQHRRTLQLKDRNHFEHKPPREKQLSLFALSLLVLPFLPASNFLFPVGFVLAERILYLPSLGICLLIAIGIDKLQSRKGGSVLQASLTLTVSLLLLLYSVKTLRRNLDWGDSLSLAESAVPVNPSNAKVFMTIGNHHAQKGNRRCELFYRQALHLRPNYTAAWTNLGLVLLNTERPKEAEDCYRRALSIKADHVNANTNMGHLCRIQERWDEAVIHYSTVLRRRPRNPLLHYYLGFVYEQLISAENRQSAEREYGIAVDQHPGHWESHLALARLLSTTSSNGVRLKRGYTKGKRLDKAIFHYQRVLQFRPNDDGARFELGRLLLWKGFPLEAKKELSIALQLNPKHVGAHLELGNTLERLGEREQAAGELRKALELDPSLQLAKQKLEELLASL